MKPRLPLRALLLDKPLASKPHSLKFRPQYLPPLPSSFTEQADILANYAIMRGEGLYGAQDTFARSYILLVLDQTQSIQETAVKLKITVNILRRWMKHLHIHPGQLILDFPESQPRKQPQRVTGLARVSNREAK